ncbi:serine/threonine protein kinase [Streptomyces netropsis]|uniref:non-specific serine/threonine protein kinase n=1 Tax=Streptomyces netropsis TaxID=55404 RepID=A0A7W7LFZ8_STRNE|nr:serine/threonine-protein kinase [Streptomyces netropsis]MBB4889553.1 serine/threonine protein kinase [Streptomyces netropsis]
MEQRVRVLAGRYRLLEILGTGGFGEVWTAHDHVIGRTVAVKLLRDPGSAEAVAMFHREARTAGGVNHPGIVTVHDLGQDVDGTLFLVMERLHGRDLATVLSDTGRPLDVDLIVEWAGQVCAALEVAHAAGMVHRDLKPANLFLTTDGRVKVLDFGIARYIDSASATASRVFGTLAYMAPERLSGRAGDHRADLYSLGCVLYELLTGRTPLSGIEGDALDQVGLPQAFEHLVSDLLAKDPDDRPANAAIVHERLRALPPRSARSSGRPPGHRDNAAGAGALRRSELPPPPAPRSPARWMAVSLGLVEDEHFLSDGELPPFPFWFTVTTRLNTVIPSREQSPESTYVDHGIQLVPQQWYLAVGFAVPKDRSRRSGLFVRTPHGRTVILRDPRKVRPGPQAIIDEAP